MPRTRRASTSLFMPWRSAAHRKTRRFFICAIFVCFFCCYRPFCREERPPLLEEQLAAMRCLQRACRQTEGVGSPNTSHRGRRPPGHGDDMWRRFHARGWHGDPKTGRPDRARYLPAAARWSARHFLPAGDPDALRLGAIFVTGWSARQLRWLQHIGARARIHAPDPHELKQIFQYRGSAPKEYRRSSYVAEPQL